MAADNDGALFALGEGMGYRGLALGIQIGV